MRPAVMAKAITGPLWSLQSCVELSAHSARLLVCTCTAACLGLGCWDGVANLGVILAQSAVLADVAGGGVWI